MGGGGVRGRGQRRHNHEALGPAHPSGSHWLLRRSHPLDPTRVLAPLAGRPAGPDPRFAATQAIRLPTIRSQSPHRRRAAPHSSGVQATPRRDGGATDDPAALAGESVAPLAATREGGWGRRTRRGGQHDAPAPHSPSLHQQWDEWGRGHGGYMTRRRSPTAAPNWEAASIYSPTPIPPALSSEVKERSAERDKATNLFLFSNERTMTGGDSVDLHASR